MKMWTRETVLELLTQYNANRARVGHLRLEIEKLRATIEYILANIEAVQSPLKAQVITDMPHGTSVGDPTAELAVKIADRRVPSDVNTMRQEIRDYEEELKTKNQDASYVDAWLKALNTGESWIVVHRIINEETWTDVLYAYQNGFGHYASKSALNRLKKRAMQKIYNAAGIH